jgi:hypothetical protein
VVRGVCDVKGGQRVGQRVERVADQQFIVQHGLAARHI